MNKKWCAYLHECLISDWNLPKLRQLKSILAPLSSDSCLSLVEIFLPIFLPSRISSLPGELRTLRLPFPTEAAAAGIAVFASPISTTGKATPFPRWEPGFAFRGCRPLLRPFGTRTRDGCSRVRAVLGDNARDVCSILRPDATLQRVSKYVVCVLFPGRTNIAVGAILDFLVNFVLHSQARNSGELIRFVLIHIEHKRR